MGFLEVFKDLKAEKNVSLSKIAKETGIPITTLSNYVNRGSIPRCDQLNLLANFFNCSVDYLIGNEDNYTIPTTQGIQSLSQEEKDLIKYYRAIEKPAKLAILNTAKSFYNQTQTDKKSSYNA